MVSPVGPLLAPRSTTREVATGTLVREVARRHGLTPGVASGVARRSIEEAGDHLSLGLLAAALEHSSDCASPDCDRCLAISERLEEPDTMSVRALVDVLQDTELLRDEVLRLLRSISDAAPGETARSLERLRRIVEGDMATSSYSLQRRRRIAFEALNMNRQQIAALSKEVGVAPTTIYNWRRDLTNAGEEAIAAAAADDAPPVKTESLDDLREQLTLFAARVRDLEATLADQAADLYRYKRALRDAESRTSSE